MKIARDTYTQKEFAAILRVSKNTISHYENGATQEMDIRTLEDWADKSPLRDRGVTREWLIRDWVKPPRKGRGMSSLPLVIARPSDLVHA